MHIEERGLVYDAARQGVNRRVAFFTSLCVLRSGAILCGYQVGAIKHAPDSTLGLCRSRDGGATWEPSRAKFDSTVDGVPGSLAVGEIVQTEPGRLRMLASWFDRSDPKRPLFDPATEGILHSKLLESTSDDEGESWSTWNVVPTPGLSGCSSTGPVVQWSDGAMAYAFESYKEFDEPGPARHAAWLMVSRDGARTRTAPILVARDPRNEIYYWDQRLCATSRPGEFVALFWTHNRAAQQDLDVHLLRAAVDGDRVQGGSIRSTGIPGQISAPLVLDDGRLLAFVVDRARPGTMKLWVSRDGGDTSADCLVVHAHDEQAVLATRPDKVDFAEYWEDMAKWSFGHPAIRRLDKQRVLVAYYAGTPETMSIHCARVNVA
jgi:hypothetical protein